MKHLLVYCCVFTCTSVNWTADYETDKPGYDEIEAVGEACKKCQAENKQLPKFTPMRFGQTDVTKPEDFGKLMKDRKNDHKKRHGGKR